MVGLLAEHSDKSEMVEAARKFVLDQKFASRLTVTRALLLSTFRLLDERARLRRPHQRGLFRRSSCYSRYVCLGKHSHFSSMSVCIFLGQGLLRLVLLLSLPGRQTSIIGACRQWALQRFLLHCEKPIEQLFHVSWSKVRRGRLKPFGAGVRILALPNSL